MKKDKLTEKKLTLTAWTKILYQQGIIDLGKCSKMLTLINMLDK